MVDRRTFPIIAQRCPCGFLASAMSREALAESIRVHDAAIHLPNPDYIAHTRQHT